MDGIHSPSHWLAWKAGLSSAHASQLVTVAKRPRVLPVTAAFDAGELSLDQVVPIATRRRAGQKHELCQFAELDDGDAAGGCCAPTTSPDPTTGDDDDPNGGSRRRVLSLWHLDDGRWELHGGFETPTTAPC